MSKPVTPDEFARRSLIDVFAKGRLEEAEAMCQQFVKQYPKHNLAFKVQGAIHVKQAKYDLAVKCLQKAITLAPTDWEAFNSMGLAFKGLGKVANAESAYRQCLKLKADYAPAYTNLGTLFRETGKPQEALKYYTKKLELDPHDEETRHVIASLSGARTDTAPRGYVRALFDSYAGHFDSHLVASLNYQVPAKLAELHRQYTRIQTLGQVLDLGCGTGLVAEACKGQGGQWHGVDLSPAMLAKAEEKSLYAQLTCGDVLETMQGLASHTCDAIFAADVFIYVGDIHQVAREAARLLTPKGLFIFSVEELVEDSDAPGFSLLETGRYAHSKAYIQKLAQQTGLDILTLEPTEVRKEADRRIDGLIAVLHVST